MTKRRIVYLKNGIPKVSLVNDIDDVFTPDDNIVIKKIDYVTVKPKKSNIWVDIPNYKGLYQLGDAGYVKSIARTSRRNGAPFIVKEKILKDKDGVVCLYKNNKGITHRIEQLLKELF